MSEPYTVQIDGVTVFEAETKDDAFHFAIYASKHGECIVRRGETIVATVTSTQTDR